VPRAPSRGWRELLLRLPLERPHACVVCSQEWLIYNDNVSIASTCGDSADELAPVDDRGMLSEPMDDEGYPEQMVTAGPQEDPDEDSS
jgi:hypothetical protein